MNQNEEKQTPNTSIVAKASSLLDYGHSLQIPDNIQSLLWFADGPFKNLTMEEKYNTIIINDKIKFSFKTSFREEPSLIYTDLPIDLTTTLDSKETIGYYPSYRRLTPQQRYNYLNWLCDIRQAVDIGYVFILYYGLERHLLYGRYKDAVDVILNLRLNHTNHSFSFYSASSLIGSALLHKDKDLLIHCLQEIGDSPIHVDIAFLAKYLLKCDLSPGEIISCRSAVGFKRTTYLKEQADLFVHHLSSILISEFGTGSFPFYELILHPPEKQIAMFANVSLPMDIRYPNLPSLIDDANLKAALYKLLELAHEAVKKDVSIQRKTRERTFK